MKIVCWKNLRALDVSRRDILAAVIEKNKRNRKKEKGRKGKYNN